MDRTLRLWELNTGRKLAVAKTDVPVTNFVAFSRDGRWAVSGGGWDFDSRKGYVTYGDFALRLWQIPARTYGETAVRVPDGADLKVGKGGQVGLPLPKSESRKQEMGSQRDHSAN